MIQKENFKEYLYSIFDIDDNPVGIVDYERLKRFCNMSNNSFKTVINRILKNYKTTVVVESKYYIIRRVIE